MKSTKTSERSAKRKTARDDIVETLFREAYPMAVRSAKFRARAFPEYDDMGHDDLVQEVLIAVWTALSRFDPARAGLRTFVERISANSIASAFRRKRATKRVMPASYRPAAAPQLLVNVELRVDLQRALRRLSKRDQEIAFLLRAEDTPSDIARVLTTSRTSVYESIGRLRLALRELGLAD
jgi:RNA polymerase sigma-70 factor (ECF subfamily)